MIYGETMLRSAADTVEQRREEYGHSTENFEVIGQRWTLVLGTPVTAAQVAVCLIDLKLARLRKDPAHKDSILDIAGYAACLWEVTQTPTSE